jgi:hypothetical protein
MEEFQGEYMVKKLLIHEQLGISKQGAVDAPNATFEETKTTF